MIRVTENCKGCRACEDVCLVNAINVKNKKAVVNRKKCVVCKACLKVCEYHAITIDNSLQQGVMCDNCPIECVISEGMTGACKRYKNEKNKITRIARVCSFSEVEDIVKEINDNVIEKPLVTGIGAGTTYPDFKPSPLIVKGLVDNVEVVTVVTEAPLSYSGITVKIDSDRYIGDEGKKIYIISRGKKVAGHVCREEYGSKMLSIGGVNLLTDKHGIVIAKTIYDFISGKEIKLEIEDGAKLKIKLNRPPVINGYEDKIMRIGCGSATLGLFAPYLKELAKEVIILDGHIVGMLSEHPAGRALGIAPSGIKLNAMRSTPGRYFVKKGDGWGGTDIKNPLDIINSNGKILKEGDSLFITDTTASNAAYFIYKQGKFEKTELSDKIYEFIKLMRENCEKSNVTAVFSGGIGGSARAGVTKNPIKLTRAVHEGNVKITIGGANPFIYPGGGINFIVDLNKILKGSIYLSPTPSFVIPVECTMTETTFKKIGGHIASIRKF